MAGTNYTQDLTALLVTDGITVPIRRGVRPDTPDNLVVLTEYPGEVPEFTHGASQPYSIPARVQVLCRGEAHEHDAPMQLARRIFGLLSAVRNRTVGGKFYRHVEPIQSPSYLEQDDQNRIVVVCNYALDVQE